jgi:hypothetical protein
MDLLGENLPHHAAEVVQVADIVLCHNKKKAAISVGVESRYKK